MAEPHADVEHRRGIWRRLRLVGPDGEFLVRRGIDARLVGIYVHAITAPDPGLDLHDHPWPFLTVILRGGYDEEWASSQEAQAFARMAAEVPGACTPGVPRTWRRWSIHRMPLTLAHRITAVEPSTLTLVIRGRKSRPWGFFLPSGWVDQRAYDYRTRRPAREIRRG